MWWKRKRVLVRAGAVAHGPAACASSVARCAPSSGRRCSGASCSTAPSTNSLADHRGRLDDRPLLAAERGRGAPRAAPGSSAAPRARRASRLRAQRAVLAAQAPSSIEHRSICSTNSGLPSAAATIRARTSRSQLAVAEQVLDDRPLRRPRERREHRAGVARRLGTSPAASRAMSGRAVHRSARSARPARVDDVLDAGRGRSARPSGCRRTTHDQRPLARERLEQLARPPRRSPRAGTARRRARSPTATRSATVASLAGQRGELRRAPRRRCRRRAMPAASRTTSAQRPEGDAVAVRQAAAAQRRARRSRAVAERTRATSRDLPTPASPTSVTSCARARSSTRLANAPREQRRAPRSRPTSGASRRARGSAPSCRRRAAGTPGRARPCPSARAARPPRPRPRRARARTSARRARSRPRGAACSSRAATLTASPVTSRWPARRIAGDHLARVDAGADRERDAPARSSSSFSAAERRLHLRGRAHRAQRVVLVHASAGRTRP